jgi:hypothetical protein
VDDDLLGIESVYPLHEIEEAVPYRERVPGMKARVRELPDALERQVVELDQLADPGEVDEAVALDGARQPPEQKTERETGGRRPPRRASAVGPTRRITAAASAAAPATKSSASVSASDARGRTSPRGTRRGSSDQASGGDAPDSERGRATSLAEGGPEPERKPEVELDGGHPSRSSAALPDASQTAVAVDAPALAPEERAAQAEGRQSSTRARSAARAPSCLRRKRRWPEVLAIEAAPVRCAADVHALGPGEEQDLPARLPEPVAPIRLLTEEEVVLVAVADVFDGFSPHEHARSHHDLDISHVVVIEAPRIERVEHR